MPDKMLDEGSAAAVFRAIGRLEGRFSALETRVVNSEATQERQMGAMATKIEGLTRAINNDEIADADFRGKASGQRNMLTIIVMTVNGLLTLAIAVWAILDK